MVPTTIKPYSVNSQSQTSLENVQLFMLKPEGSAKLLKAGSMFQMTTVNTRMTSRMKKMNSQKHFPRFFPFSFGTTACQEVARLPLFERPVPDSNESLTKGVDLG